MMRTIDDERELPAPKFLGADKMPGKGIRFDYIRHLIDPRVLIGCHDGKCFVRTDGQKWKHSGWLVTREANGKITHDIGAAKDDLKVYDYAVAEVSPS